MKGRRPDAGANLALLCAAMLLAALVAGRATRDALFLAHFEVADLPLMMVAAAGMSMLMAVLTSFAQTRLSPALAIPVALGCSSALFVGEWMLLESAPDTGVIALYLHMDAMAMVALSGFWSVVNERFDPYTAKDVVSRAGGFGALGGVLGGLATLLIAPRVGLETLLLGFAGLHASAGVAIFALGRPVAAGRQAQPPTAGPTGLSQLVGSPFVLRMATLVVLVAITDELIAFAFKASAVAAYSEPDALLRFFAIFYTGANLLAFAMQTSLGGRALRGLGLGGTIALLPMAVATTSGIAAFVGNLVAVTAARVANASFGVSFFRAGFELLWTPIPTVTKRITKAYVDVGARSMGEMGGSGLVVLLLALLPGLPIASVLGLAVVMCVAQLFVIADLHRGYVRQLADNLRSGTIQLTQSDVEDATTSRTLVDSRMTIDRVELDARLRQLDRQQAVASAPADTPDTPERRDGEDARDLVATIEVLASGDTGRTASAIAAAAGDPRLIPFVLPLLEDSELQEAALAFLTAVAPRAIGQLEDALLDPSTPALVRRFLPRALAASDHERALAAIWRGLDDPDFEMRLACSRGAVRLIDRAPTLRRPAKDAVARVAKELEVSDRIWQQQGRRRHQQAAQSELLDTGLITVVDRSVEHIFDLLALARGRPEITSTLQALYSGDSRLRGTALEYLHSILPERVRTRLWPRIPGGAPTRSTQRSTEAMAAELLAQRNR